MKKFLSVLALGLFTTIPASANELAQAMADGGAWQMQDPSGRNSEITLQPDGTGRIRAGLMGVRATWVPADDGICLTTRPLGTICLALSQGANGFLGVAEDGGRFAFVR
ncbi:MAG: hypothetical protein AAF754_19820 [Pseudomonadota bacterium]